MNGNVTYACKFYWKLYCFSDRDGSDENIYLLPRAACAGIGSSPVILITGGSLLL